MLNLLLKAGSPPPFSGTSGGPLRVCGKKPNCVCSKNQDSKHQIEPIKVEGKTWDELKSTISLTLKKMPNNRIVNESDNYIRAEFTSSLFKFVDDFEFHFVLSENVLQMRSASRVGYSDLGANRKRAELFQQLFAQTLSSEAAVSQD